MLADFSDFITVTSEGLRLTVRAKPGIAKARAPRVVDIGDGKRALEITVAAAAEDGKANRAIAEQLAELFHVRKNAVTIGAGATGRVKLIDVAGDAAALLKGVTPHLQG